jgi:hypothetical protein
VDHRRSFSSLPVLFDDFLFAPVCEDGNGMRVSVLSALARMDVDPWEEAGRLATMPRAAAARLLASSLDLVFEKVWIPAGAGAIAAQLVRLLPPAADDVPPEAAVDQSRPGSQPQARAGVRWKSYWLVWLAVAVAITIMSPRNQTTPAVSDLSAPQSSTATVHDGGAAQSGDPSPPQ